MPRFEGMHYYVDKDDVAIAGWIHEIDKVIRWCQGYRQLDVGAGNVTLSPDTTRADIANYPGLNYQCDASEIPVDDRAFDFVFSSHCIEHVDNLEKTLREWCRVAQKYVIFITPNGEPYLTVSQEELDRMGHKHVLLLSDVWNLAQLMSDTAEIQELGYTSEGMGSIYCVLKKRIW